MPNVNIPPMVRFILYLAAVIGGVIVQYTIDKSWFGEAEFRLWSGIATLLMLLAAAKTNISDSGAKVNGTVVSETGERGHIAAVVGGPESDAADGHLPFYEGAYDGEEGDVEYADPNAEPAPYDPDSDPENASGDGSTPYVDRGNDPLRW